MMNLRNEILVATSADRAWRLFDQIERVVPCMPGATYRGQQGDASLVALKVKVGAITAQFDGSLRFVERDEAARTAVIQGSGKDTGGKGQANATIRVALRPVSELSTRLEVDTELGITGRLAQFGGPTIAEIASRIVQQFTVQLNQLLAAEDSGAPAAEAGQATVVATPNTAAAEAVPPPPAPTDALDLGSMLGRTAVAAAARYSAVALLFLALGWCLGRFA
jgi:carbon monoxide dehydrogenase subunit G